MSRVESLPTWEMWNVPKALWLVYLDDSGMRKKLIDYYATGITLMEASNKTMIGTHSYADLVEKKLDKTVNDRVKVIEFYKKRLKELQD